MAYSPFWTLLRIEAFIHTGWEVVVTSSILDSIYCVLNACLIKRPHYIQWHNLAHLGMTFWAGYINVSVIFYLSLIVILLAALFLEICQLIPSFVRMTSEGRSTTASASHTASHLKADSLIPW